MLPKAVSVKVLGVDALHPQVRLATLIRTYNLKFTGLTQNLGQLYGSYRGFQSNFWVNLRILGQPCEFYLPLIRTLC
jgi:hypothetical protein